ISGLSAGNYSITITDAQGCTFSKSLAVGYSQYSPNFYVNISGGAQNCSNTGSLKAIPVNGKAPFRYSWSNGANTSSITNVPQGIYFVTVTDDNGCTAVGTATITPFCVNIISGFLFNDANNNCQKDAGEVPLVGYGVSASNGSQTFYGWTDTNGYYEIQVSGGNYTISTYNYSGCSEQLQPCGPTTASFTSNGGSSPNHNFTISNISTYDLTVHANWTEANPGFNKDYYIYYGNNTGSVFSGSASITMKYDPILVYLSSNGPAPTHNAAAKTLTWTINNIGTNHFMSNPPLHAKFNVPVGTSPNALVLSEFHIDPTSNDCNPVNNNFSSLQPVTGSYDPNIKEVVPSGNITVNDTILIYTIHFQNTGNDTTHFVVIIDTLPFEVEPSSVAPVAWSHLFSWFTVTGNGGVLRVEFNPIYLVDSATNESASKGFITFR
ncbi:MAG: hypothetical protein NZ108_10060, partial [Bacteroidia bacterium]|nr:hypothetical protein [Bacteroidia bacterium]